MEIQQFHYADDGSHPPEVQLGSLADRDEAFRLRAFLEDDISARRVTFDPWIRPEHKRNLSSSEETQVRVVHLFSSRMWDVLYLIGVVIFVLGLMNLESIPSMNSLLGFLMLFLSALSFIPSAAALCLNVAMQEDLQILAVEESRTWGVFFVMTLKALSGMLRPGMPPVSFREALTKLRARIEAAIQELRSAKVANLEKVAEEVPEKRKSSEQVKVQPASDKKQWRCVVCSVLNTYEVDIDKLRLNPRKHGDVHMSLERHPRTGHLVANFTTRKPLLRCRKCATPMRYRPRHSAKHLFASNEEKDPGSPKEAAAKPEKGRSLQEKALRFRTLARLLRSEIFRPAESKKDVETQTTDHGYVLPVPRPPPDPPEKSRLHGWCVSKKRRLEECLHPAANLLSPCCKRLAQEYLYSRRLLSLFKLSFLDDTDNDANHYLYFDFRLKRILAEEYSVKVPRFGSTAKELFVGQPVESTFQQDVWYPGVITRKHGNDTFDILYDNGQEVSFVKPKDIRGRPKLKQLFIPKFSSGASVVLFILWPLTITMYLQGGNPVLAVLPLFLYSSALCGALVYEFIAQKYFSAGFMFCLRIWVFFFMPYVWLWLYSTAILAAVDRPGTADWGGVLFLAAMFSSFSCLIMGIVEPIVGYFFAVLSVPWLVFHVLLFVHMTQIQEKGEATLPLVVVLTPMLLLLGGISVGYAFLPYVWNATVDNGDTMYYYEELDRLIQKQQRQVPFERRYTIQAMKKGLRQASTLLVGGSRTDQDALSSLQTRENNAARTESEARNASRAPTRAPTASDPDSRELKLGSSEKADLPLEERQGNLDENLPGGAENTEGEQ